MGLEKKAKDDKKGEKKTRHYLDSYNFINGMLLKMHTVFTYRSMLLIQIIQILRFFFKK